jgi:hypothetical protein
MSGRKVYPISITNVQWETMNRAVQTARTEAHSAAENRRKAEAEARRRIQDMQNRCNEQINGLNRELQNQANRQADALRQAQNDFAGRLERQQTAYDQAMREQKAELEQRLRVTRAEIQAEINSINSRMEGERKNQAEIANFWITQAHILLNDIDSKYRHRLFAAGEFDGLNSRLRQAENDVLNPANLSQAAIASAREVCNSAMELRERVIIAEAEWTNTFDIANRSLVESTNRIEGLELLEYTLQEDGKDIKVAAEIDHWSDGALCEVKNEIENLRGIIAKPDILSIERLQDVIAQIKHLDSKITDSENTARNNFLASQLRREIGAEMEEKLPGWILNEVLFEGEDERKDLHLIFTHINGSDQLSLIIQGGQQGRDSARVVSDFFCNSHRSGDTRDGWIKEITDVIQGFEPNARPVCAPEYAGSLDGNRAALDVDSIKQGSPSV